MTSGLPLASSSVVSPPMRSAPLKYALLSDARLASSVKAPAAASTIQLAFFIARSLSSGSGLLAQPGADAPQVGEGALGQGGLEVAHARAASGAAERPDHALDHLHVVRAPEGEALVDLDEDLAQGEE